MVSKRRKDLRLWPCLTDGKFSSVIAGKKNFSRMLSDLSLENLARTEHLKCSGYRNFCISAFRAADRSYLPAFWIFAKRPRIQHTAVWTIIIEPRGKKVICDPNSLLQRRTRAAVQGKQGSRISAKQTGTDYLQLVCFQIFVHKLQQYGLRIRPLRPDLGTQHYFSFARFGRVKTFAQLAVTFSTASGSPRYTRTAFGVASAMFYDRRDDTISHRRS